MKGSERSEKVTDADGESALSAPTREIKRQHKLRLTRRRLSLYLLLFAFSLSVSDSHTHTHITT